MPEIAVQVKSASSKVYYVFSWGGEGGKWTVERANHGQRYRIRCDCPFERGHRIQWPKLYIQRQTTAGNPEIIEVDLDHVLKRTVSNPPILPGDRIFVNRRPPAAAGGSRGGKVGSDARGNRKDKCKVQFILLERCRLPPSGKTYRCPAAVCDRAPGYSVNFCVAALAQTPDPHTTAEHLAGTTPPDDYQAWQPNPRILRGRARWHAELGPGRMAK